MIYALPLVILFNLFDLFFCLEVSCQAWVPWLLLVSLLIVLLLIFAKRINKLYFVILWTFAILIFQSIKIISFQPDKIDNVINYDFFLFDLHDKTYLLILLGLLYIFSLFNLINLKFRIIKKDKLSVLIIVLIFFLSTQFNVFSYHFDDFSPYLRR